MPRTIPVTEIMSAPAVTVTPDTTVEQALEVLSSERFNGLPVVDGDGRLVGMLDNSDLIVAEARLHGPTMIEILGAYIPLPGEQRRFEEQVRHALGTTVDDLMDRSPARVRSDATLEDVATLITDREVARVAVVDGDGRVVGIITRSDLVRAMYRRDR